MSKFEDEDEDEKEGRGERLATEITEVTEVTEGEEREQGSGFRVRGGGDAIFRISNIQQGISNVQVQCRCIQKSNINIQVRVRERTGVDCCSRASAGDMLLFSAAGRTLSRKTNVEDEKEGIGVRIKWQRNLSVPVPPGLRAPFMCSVAVSRACREAGDVNT